MGKSKIHKFYKKIKLDWLELELNFKGEKSYIHLLWVFIAIVCFIVLPQFLGWWYTMLVVAIIIAGRFLNMQIKTFLTILTLSIAILSLYNQNKLMEKQISQFELDKRPYLFMKFSNPVFSPRPEDLLFGPYVTFINYGKFPASDIKIEHKIYDDKGGESDFERWHTDTFGGFPEIECVPPNDIATEPQPYIPGIKKDAVFACAKVAITYRGFNPDVLYWTEQEVVYKILRDDNNNPKSLELIGQSVVWDKNTKINPSFNLKEPDWKKYRR